jgi:hypothetical protein
MSNKVSKSLELLLIPLFALMTHSCGNSIDYGSVKLPNGHKYIVSVDTSLTLKATRDGSSVEGNPGFYQLIDSLADGKNVIARKMIGGNDEYKPILTGPADSTDLAEHKMIYNNPTTQELLKIRLLHKYTYD